MNIEIKRTSLYSTLVIEADNVRIQEDIYNHITSQFKFSMYYVKMFADVLEEIIELSNSKHNLLDLSKTIGGSLSLGDKKTLLKYLQKEIEYEEN